MWSAAAMPPLSEHRPCRRPPHKKTLMFGSLGIVGGGRAAWAFGSTWRRIGWPIAGVTLRDDFEGRTPCAPTDANSATAGRGAQGAPSPIASLLETRRLPLDDLARDSDPILIAVSDAAIAELAQRIPPTNAVIFHCSGSMTSVRGRVSPPPFRALAQLRPR